MIPYLTKHYALGLLVGVGFGLFLAYLLADAGSSPTRALDACSALGSASSP